MQPTKKQSDTASSNSRREFMQQIALCYMAANIPLSFLGCQSDDNMFVGSGKVPYKIWEEMLMALQTCPDYLEGRMKSLVASKDAQAMFNFVRDEIYLMPANSKSIGYIGTQFKWGIKGALRYGMATPREKAELLHQMFAEAGIPSKVVFERTNIQPEEAMTFFLRPIQRKFNLELSKKQWKQWKKELQIDNNEDYKIPVLDSDFKKTNALANQLWELIPNKETLNKSDFDFRWDNYRTPTVEFQIDGVTKYAHLFDANIPFGELKNKGNISEANPIKLNEETVEIRLSYREAIHPDKEIELISGSWKSTDLIGNQIHFACLNGLDLEQSAMTPIGNLRIFTPTLAFQDFDATLETMEKRSFIADPITLEGEKLILATNNETSNAPVVLNPTNPELLKTVNQLAIKAIPINKPLVKIQVSPTDSEGKIVEGLQVQNFKFLDNKQPIQALMESNRRTPKILILFDASGSMPKEYYGENMNKFVTSLKENIQANFPAAIVDTWSTPSELFTWLLKASKTSYDLILFATDGDNNDVYNEQDLATYQNGPPALILNVYNDNSANYKKTFDKMAAITNGMVLNAKDQNIVIEKVVEYVNAMDIPPYTFTYYANDETQHELVLAMDKERLHASAIFEFNALNKEHLNLGVIGMYLDLKVGNIHTKRVLAGWDPVTQINQKPTKAHFLDVKSLILGDTTFYFEGEGPTLATSLVDTLKFKLSTRGWGEALLDNDLPKAKTEFEKGGFQYHSNILTLMAPLEEGVTNSTFTFASGIRIGVCKQQIHIEDKKTIQSFDFLPTSNYVSFNNGNANAFKINLQKTAQLAIREASLFNKSTLSHLNGKELVERTQAISDNWFTSEERNKVDTYYWNESIYRGDGNYKLFDSAGVSKAFWQINAEGEVYGVLRDGTGGGSGQEIVDQLSKIMAAISIYISIIQKSGALNSIGATSLAIVAVYGVTLTKLYAIVCESLVVMDTSGMDDKIKEALKELAFNVAKTIAYGFGGNTMGNMGGLDSLISMMGVSTNPYS
ncbi:MAG: hypothetical protein COZ17_04020 [Flavobacteriaceae bacterium CG_4_10_14_3_um_filter_33_47]|nr:hypothetical protein [Flavobacteriales bacterium]PIY12305.1 MAG: hypothetical protein COZ17_04020 [Flavobacteriaceae bacterium CG_4_10_14_3_um_filter_33_47]